MAVVMTAQPPSGFSAGSHKKPATLNMLERAGTVLVTSDNPLIRSGKPVRVFHVHEIYGASSAGSQLRNGTTDSSTVFVSLTSSDNAGVSTDFGVNGILFPNGCFYDEGANTVSATITCKLEA